MSARASIKQVKLNATRGVFWTGGAQIVRQIISIGTSVTLARLLLPEEFGLLGMAMVFVGFSQLFVNFGIGAAIVQRREIDARTVTSAWWTNFFIGVSLAVLLVLFAPVMARFYATPAIEPVVAVLAMLLVVAAATVIPMALLYRSMRFDQVVRAEVLGALCGAAVALALALKGMGVWSLVAQPLVGNIVTLVVAWRCSGWFPTMQYSWESVSDLVRFSGGVLGSNALGYANRKADDLLIGKFLGSEPLGYYGLAYELMLYPLSQVAGVIVKVLFPTLSQLREDPERFRTAYLKSVSAIATVTVPMMLGLFAVSHEFVLVVFGEKWLPMEPILRVFCFVGMMQSVATTVGSIYLSMGATGLMFRLSAAMTPVVIIAFFVGLPWGVIGVANAYAIVSFALFYVTLGFAFRLVKIRFSQFHRVITRKLIAGVGMLAVLESVISLFPDAYSPALRLGVLVPVGAVIYMVLIWVFDRREIEFLSATMRAALRST